MLALPGFVGARILEVETGGPDGWPRRSVHYHLADREALERYLAEHAERMRADGAGRFGASIRAERRILTQHAAPAPAAPIPRCLNCDTILHGQYCGVCGQRASSRLISLWELVRDGLGDLLDMDSRLWRTLRALLTRPGYLTSEYLQGRRARFMPPFRMYLAFSLLFFLVAFFDTGDLPVNIEVDLGAEQSEEVRGEVAEFGPGPQQESEAAGPGQAEVERRPAAIADPLQDGRLAEKTPADTAPAEVAADRQPTAAEIEAARKTCAGIEVDLGAWLNERIGEERIRQACERVILDRGRNLSRVLIDDLPAAMFLFLPLLAAVLKLLYPLSRRYYVEHLLFIVHYQSFVFLLLTLQVLLTRLLGWLDLATGLAVLSGVLVACYIPVYLHRAMRRVYRQRFLPTFIKFITLSLTYFIAFVATMGITFVVAALSI